MTRRKIRGDNSPPHLILLRIGMRRKIIHPSTFLLEVLLQLNSAVCDVLHVAADQADVPAPKKILCGNLTSKLALFRAIHFYKKG